MKRESIIEKILQDFQDENHVQETTLDKGLKLLLSAIKVNVSKTY